MAAGIIISLSLWPASLWSHRILLFLCILQGSLSYTPFYIKNKPETYLSVFEVVRFSFSGHLSALQGPSQSASSFPILVPTQAFGEIHAEREKISCFSP